MEQNSITQNVTDAMDMDGTMGDIKAAIVGDIKTEMDNLGIKFKENRYDWGQHITDIMFQFKDIMVKYDIEKERITTRYSKEVANNKMAELDVNLKADINSLVYDLEMVQKDADKYRQQQIADLQSDKNYLEAKKVAFDTLVMLKGIDNIPVDIWQDITMCMANAYDLKSLRLAQVLMGENSEAGKRTGYLMENLRGQMSISECTPYIRDAKNFISSRGKNDSVALFGLLNKYGK